MNTDENADSEKKDIPPREELLALLNPKSRWWAALPDASFTRQKIIDHCFDEAPSEVLALLRELKRRAFLVPMDEDGRVVPIHEKRSFQFNGVLHGLTPQGIEWLSQEESPPPDPLAVDDVDLTPEGLVMLLNPSDPRWNEFEDPDRTREFMTTQVVMRDPDAFEAMLQQCVALGLVETRRNASGEIEYGLTDAGRMWVEDGMPPIPPAATGPIPPAA